MSIRVLLLDLDGTTLEKDQVTISQRNVDAMTRAMQRGIYVIPCTGRVLDMYPPQLMRMDGIRYCISGHGARIFDRRTGQSLYCDLISPVDSARVCRVFEHHGIYAEIAAQNTIFLEKEVDDCLDEMPVPSHHCWYIRRDHCQTVVETPSEYFFSHGMEIEKVDIYGIPKPLQQEIYDELAALHCIRFTEEATGPNLEFTSPTASKEAAVQVLLKELGVGFEECMVMGDSACDQEMIRKAGLGIAMGNAPDWLKADADDVAPENDQDGVAVMIEKYL